tara:strand:- start:675 stop:1427 length:753 start_codon:yes stop_codon:yes gene_type:complete
MPFDYLDNYKFTPFSHRGGSIENDENTLEAFEKSINLGYQYIETDVRHTKDNKLVIFHDADLKRICNLDVSISSLSFKELQEYKIFNKHKIPLLSEALNTWSNVYFNIEPKSEESAYLLLDELKKQKDLNRFCVGSFKSANLSIMRVGLKHKICTSMSQDEVINFFINRLFPFFNNNAPCIQIPMYFYGVQIVTKNLVDHVHNLGKKIHVWTINDESEMKTLIDYEVDGIMTDRPKKLKELLLERLLWPH